MKKIDILNFISDFRKAPNSIKTQQQIVSHLGIQHEPIIQSMLEDLQKAKVVKQTDLNGEKAYQVIAK
jgi:arginine repressor